MPTNISEYTKFIESLPTTEKIFFEDKGFTLEAALCLGGQTFDAFEKYQANVGEMRSLVQRFQNKPDTTLLVEMERERTEIQDSWAEFVNSAAKDPDRFREAGKATAVVGGGGAGAGFVVGGPLGAGIGAGFGIPSGAYLGWQIANNDIDEDETVPSYFYAREPQDAYHNQDQTQDRRAFEKDFQNVQTGSADANSSLEDVETDFSQNVEEDYLANSVKADVKKGDLVSPHELEQELIQVGTKALRDFKQNKPVEENFLEFQLISDVLDLINQGEKITQAEYDELKRWIAEQTLKVVQNYESRDFRSDEEATDYLSYEGLDVIAPNYGRSHAKVTTLKKDRIANCTLQTKILAHLHWATANLLPEGQELIVEKLPANAYGIGHMQLSSFSEEPLEFTNLVSGNISYEAEGEAYYPEVLWFAALDFHFPHQDLEGLTYDDFRHPSPLASSSTRSTTEVSESWEKDEDEERYRETSALPIAKHGVAGADELPPEFVEKPKYERGNGVLAEHLQLGGQSSRSAEGVWQSYFDAEVPDDTQKKKARARLRGVTKFYKDLGVLPESSESLTSFDDVKAYESQVRAEVTRQLRQAKSDLYAILQDPFLIETLPIERLKKIAGVMSWLSLVSIPQTQRGGTKSTLFELDGLIKSVLGDDIVHELDDFYDRHRKNPKAWLMFYDRLPAERLYYTMKIFNIESGAHPVKYYLSQNSEEPHTNFDVLRKMMVTDQLAIAVVPPERENLDIGFLLDMPRSEAVQGQKYISRSPETEAPLSFAASASLDLSMDDYYQPTKTYVRPVTVALLHAASLAIDRPTNRKSKLQRWDDYIFRMSFEDPALELDRLLFVAVVVGGKLLDETDLYFAGEIGFEEYQKRVMAYVSRFQIESSAIYID